LRGEELTEFAEEIQAFLVESHENLGTLDRQIVDLEMKSGDERRMASVFRTIHSLKGISEFFGFHVIGSIAHLLESLLGQVQDTARLLTPTLTSLTLEALNALKHLLLATQLSNQEGDAEARYRSIRA
jgi:two-component system chemotaxis sensor kinase CheA